MGLLRSDDTDEQTGETTFKPVGFDGRYVVGVLNRPDDPNEIVKVKESEFNLVDCDEIDRVVE
jgi:uncharacterized protein YegJ (DUF2314 family)